ncbi:MAG TPA: hypothetical protein VNE63_23855 [Candidatus Acidoferrales bacterium]|nr:hypothetical protein [Candidatus Acidoferrales bacterium]
MHRLVAILLLLLCGSSACRAEKRTIHGFVIEVISPTKFKIDDYDMSCDEQFSLDFNEIAPPNILNVLKRENIRVGTEIEIKGDVNRSTHQLTVKSVHVFPTSPHQFNSTALLEKPPKLQKTASGWSGYIFTDGERVQVTNSTGVTLRANRNELEKFKAQNKGRSARKARHSHHSIK